MHFLNIIYHHLISDFTHILLPAMNSELCVHVMLSKVTGAAGTGGGDEKNCLK
jgi:hypothetical protein